MPGVRHATVTPEEDGQKLARFLERRLGPSVPGSLVMRLVRTGRVRVDKKRAKPFDRLRAGQVVRIPPVRLDEPETPAPAAAPLPIVFEAPGVIALAKPAGLPVQPGTGHADAVSERLRAMYPKAPFTPTPAHRLDRDTSGVLLAGTTYKGLRALQEAFKDHSLHKDYLAWVHGRMEPGSTMEMADAMSKQGPRGKERMRLGSGKAALATVRCLAVRGGHSLVAVRLHTGRTHQIRAQLASRGLPIVGDRKYGDKNDGEGLRLHAWRVEWPDGHYVELPPEWEGTYAVGELPPAARDSAPGSRQK